MSTFLWALLAVTVAFCVMVVVLATVKLYPAVGTVLMLVMLAVFLTMAVGR